MTALDLTARWPVANVSAAVVRAGETVETIGDTRRTFALASLTKPLVAWAVLVAVEEGVVGLDDDIDGIGQPGCTMRHLLSHAGGFPFEGREPIGAPARFRGYSNGGIEIAADTLTLASGIGVAEYLDEAVLQPLAMTSTTLAGSPAHGGRGCVADMARFVGEMRRPTSISVATRDDAFSSTYPELSGIVPGVGRFAPCPWGLGFELRGGKSPHWTGQRNSARTVGHFGGAGTMFWYDPDIDLGVVALTDETFGPWALDAWPALSDAVIAEYAP
jgi:CubicO group peptidase (beta-lactamase class C family)